MAVFRIDVRVRQLLLQHFIQFRCFKGFQVSTQAVVRRFIAEFITVCYGIHIQAGTADQEGKFAAGKNIVYCFIGQALEISHGEEFTRLPDIQQMVGDAVHLLPGDFPGTEIQTAENLPGIRGYDFASETGSQLNPQGAFPGSVCPLDYDQFRKHFPTPLRL